MCRLTMAAAFLVVNMFLAVSLGSAAADSAKEVVKETEQSALSSGQDDSPWLVTPLFSSDPKVGTAIGGMAGYLFRVDEESTASMIGVGGNYSDTDSFTFGVFFRSFWDADNKRIMAMVVDGEIRNDYEDFLGSGLPAQTTDDIDLYFARYMQSFADNWFVGLQGVYTNYMITGDNYDSQQIIDTIGLTGIDSGAVGVVLMYDNLDNQNSPATGKYLLFHNFAFRESLGGEEDFDAYNLAFKHYIPNGDGHVFAYHANGRWTSDASVSGYSSVALRGYVRGEYLAPHSVMFEAEQRWNLNGRYGATVFTGVACLYGDGEKCDTSKNLYPVIGLGAQIMLKESEKMVVTMDYAKGKGDNSGFYIRFGQAF